MNHTPEVFWFKNGGSIIGLPTLKNSSEVPPRVPLHYTIIYAKPEHGFFLQDGTGNNCIYIMTR